MARAVISLRAGLAAGALGLTLLATGTLEQRLSSAEPSCQIAGVERIVAIGDVHGAYDRFVDILRAARLLDARLRWSGGRAHFVQTGDVLDRGPDSRRVLDLLERLSDEAPRAGGAVHVLLGNHEVMRMLGDLRYVTSGEYEAFVTPRSVQLRLAYLKSQPVDSRDRLLNETPFGFVEMRQAFGRNGPYGEWLRKLKAVVQINQILFLHGGISPKTASLSCDAINTTIRRELTADIEETRASPATRLATSPDGPLWYRGLAEETDTFGPEVDQILAKQHVRAIVIGHTVAPGGRIRTRYGDKVIQIDTGMQPAYVADGRAAALEVEGGVFSAIYLDGRNVISGASAETVAPVPIPQ